MAHSPIAHSQAELISTNVRWLRQALDLVNRLSETDYTTSPDGFAPHRAGGHLRHIVEFYQCFLEGIATFHIDYDARRRDVAIERSPVAAAFAIRSLIHGLETCGQLRGDSTIWVRMENGDAFLHSSAARELQVLSSHTVHHFALIAVTLKLLGIVVEPEFGMAPSTLRYLASQKEAA